MYNFNVVSIGSILLFIYIIFDLLKNKGKNLLKRILFYSFIFYLLNVLQLTTGGINIPPRKDFGGVSVQLVPFHFIFNWVQLYRFFGGFSWFFWNSVRLSMYNVLMLIPFGIYLPVLFKIEKIKRVFNWSLLVTFIIEIYQLVFTYFGFTYTRTFNVDDIILNTLGGMIGFLIYKILLKNWIHKLVK